ncbi:uncharacterized protein MYCFIDRAFT_78405 [Pseudocercospora fijiensis CIRAD86]|uniref:Uncharacterized protein n=1 Tax=Pseudocercospora fijiensis (strain CIRAD86) TaxID=383855 RepID=M3A2T5_PSEFD|nr:uncharacterized protein MYCFIDRAFT_78405 [Pseudocercospora fijiensis CIRAD86]EME78706.1 hypothetical protein MYCFIDRAFT_78405 [Pseudocercospora fijiensis CIRAD86]
MCADHEQLRHLRVLGPYVQLLPDGSSQDGARLSDFIATLQVKAVTDAMAMLNSGLPMQHVISHFWPPGTRPALQTARVLAPAQTASVPSAPMPVAGPPAQLPQPGQLQHHHTMPQKSVEVIDMGSPDSEPAAKRRRNSAFEAHSQGEPPVQEGAMEQSPNADHNQIIAVSTAVSPETLPAEAPTETAPQSSSSKKGAVSRRKASGGTRCSACVRQHKKCKHNGNGGQQSREQSASAPDLTQTEGQVFRAQASAGVQAPGQFSANSNDDVFGGNHQMIGFNLDQRYSGGMGHIQPLQPHEQAELHKLLAPSEVAENTTPAAAQSYEVFRTGQDGQTGWAGGPVQKHMEIPQTENVEAGKTTNPAPKKRGGARKKT